MAVRYANLFLLGLTVIVAPAYATITNPNVTLNGSAGPFTFAPSESISVTINADVTNDGAPVTRWRSTRVAIVGQSAVCSEDPTPDVEGGGVGSTLNGTATIPGLTAPVTPGNYLLLPTIYADAACSDANGDVTLLAVSFTVADAPITAPDPARAIPAMPLSGLLLISIALLALAGRQLRSTAKRSDL
jgi:hypothetical protein